MYQRRFFSTKVGKAAMISVAAMLAFNVLTLSQQLQAAPAQMALGSKIVELA